MSKDVFTNKEQLCQSFCQSVKEQNFKAKKIEGERGGSTLKASRVLITNNNGLVLLAMGFVQFKYMFRKSWKDLLNTKRMKNNKNNKELKRP